MAICTLMVLCQGCLPVWDTTGIRLKIAPAVTALHCNTASIVRLAPDASADFFSRFLSTIYENSLGRALYAVCEKDLEGIVAKWKDAPYNPGALPLSWLKVKNPQSSQARDRHELFERA